MRITYDLHGVLEAVTALEKAVGEELPKGLWEITKAVAEEARRQHPYQNRTGNLEASTEGSVAAGSFYDDTLIASVDAFMFYASYVEDKGYAFLEPAWERSFKRIEEIANDSLGRAIDQAGWSH